MHLDHVLHIPDRGEAPRPPVSFVQPDKIAGVVKLGDLATAQVHWLWPGRIPIGRLTLLVGDSGLGKSIITLDIAARVTRGAPWPDAERQGDSETGRQGKTRVASARSLSPCLPIPPSSVVLLTAEDDLADTVRPRLEALGADCDRVYAIPQDSNLDWQDEFTAGDALRRDLKRLRQLLDALPNCRLLVIDPVCAYLGGSENSAVQVRALFQPLAALARERRIAIVAVSHLRKKEGSVLYRTSGSLTLINSARAAWLVTRDPADAERRLMLPIKSNLASESSGLAFTIESNAGRDKRLPRAAPIIKWSVEKVDVPVRECESRPARMPGRPDQEREQAKNWLRTRLADGPCLSLLIRHEAEEFGFAFRTLARAFRDMGGTAARRGGSTGFWEWQLG